MLGPSSNTPDSITIRSFLHTEHHVLLCVLMKTGAPQAAPRCQRVTSTLRAIRCGPLTYNITKPTIIDPWGCVHFSELNPSNKSGSTPSLGQAPQCCSLTAPWFRVDRERKTLWGKKACCPVPPWGCSLAAMERQPGSFHVENLPPAIPRFPF